MKKLSIASLIILSFIVFLTSWSFVESSLSRSAQLKILNLTDSTYTCSYYGNSNFKDDFYYMNKSLGLKYRGEKIIADVLMYKSDKEYTIAPFSSYTSIKNNEVIISRNIANKYDLNKGDSIVVSSSLHDNSLEYFIKEIIEPAYCFTEEYFVEDKGIIVLANNSTLIELNNMSIAFIGAEESLNGVSLEKLTSLATYKSSLWQDIFVDCSIIVGLSCLIILAYFVLFEIVSSFRIRKAIINGASTISIMKRFYLNPIVWAILYSLLLVLFVVVESLTLFNMLIIPLPLTMILIVPIVSYIISTTLMKIKLRRI